MKTNKITIGLLAPSAEARGLLRDEVNRAGTAVLELEVDQYCRTPADPPSLRFLETRPEVIIVDLEGGQSALRSLEILHTSLPESWLLVTAPVNEPELIIDSMRAGAREFLVRPFAPESLSRALGRYLSERERHQSRRRTGEIHCVTAAKGGSGATSLTINIARALADVPDTRVALIDLNTPLGDAAAYLNLKPEFTASDVLAASARLDAVLLESYMCNAEGLAVLPGPREFWKELPPGVIQHTPGAEALSRMLEVVTHTYQFALIDLSSTLEKRQMEVVLEAAKTVLVTLTPELPALWRTQRLCRFLEDCGAREKVRLVLNRTQRSDPITRDEIRKTVGHPVFWKVPNDYLASIEAINTGVPLVSANHSELSRSYRELAHRLVGLPLPKRQTGLLRLISLNRRSSHV